MLGRQRADGCVQLTSGPGHARVLARAALDAGADVVVAWGGDGTINEVASALTHSRAALGIVPMGSGNGLAREVGVPRGHEAALEAALTGLERTIDAGELNGRVFFNAAGVGFDAHVAAAFASSAGHARGFASYAALTRPGVVPIRARAPYAISPEGGPRHDAPCAARLHREHAAVGQRRAHRPRRAHGRRAPRPGRRAGPPARRRAGEQLAAVRRFDCRVVRRRDPPGARGVDSLRAGGSRARGRGARRSSRRKIDIRVIPAALRVRVPRSR